MKRETAKNRIQLQKCDELVRLMRDQSFRNDVAHALNTPFEIMVLGTMGTGKSTLLNALLGQDLLPTATDAGTAIPYRIEDCDEVEEFRCRAVLGEDIGDWQKATTDILQQWNNNDQCRQVEMQGNIPAVRNVGGRLVLHDTPGPNNAVNKRHGEITRKLLETSNYALILYMLSTCQMNTDDERNLLLMLRRMLRNNPSHKRKRVMFILSYADRFDQDKPGESLAAAIARQKRFLTKNGFRDPLIVPVMARDALLIHMKISDQPMTDMQSDNLQNALAKLKRRKAPLLAQTDCSDSVRSWIQQRSRASGAGASAKGGAALGVKGTPAHAKDLMCALLATGVPTLEAVLEEQLCTEAFPQTMLQMQKDFRVHGAYQLLRRLKTDPTKKWRK